MVTNRFSVTSRSSSGMMASPWFRRAVVSWQRPPGHIDEQILERGGAGALPQTPARVQPVQPAVLLTLDNKSM